MKRKLFPVLALVLVFILSAACLPHLRKAKQFYAEGQDQARAVSPDPEEKARTLKILRDNDNQLVYCYDKLEETLPAAESKAFAAAHSEWTKKWGWRDARTPAWKKE